MNYLATKYSLEETIELVREYRYAVPVSITVMSIFFMCVVPGVFALFYYNKWWMMITILLKYQIGSSSLLMLSAYFACIDDTRKRFVDVANKRNVVTRDMRGPDEDLIEIIQYTNISDKIERDRIQTISRWAGIASFFITVVLCIAGILLAILEIIVQPNLKEWNLFSGFLHLSIGCSLASFLVMIVFLIWQYRDWSYWIKSRTKDGLKLIL